MKVFLSSLRERLQYVVIYTLGVLVLCALAIQILFVVLDLSGMDKLATELGREFSWRFDKTFENMPGNIHYNADEQIYVRNVTNEIKLGKLAGNRNLEFGVKQVLEEYLQDKGYNLSPLAPNYLDVSIVYLDVLTTKKSFSVLSKSDKEVVIRLRGTLYKEGIKEKEVLVEESSSEISIATLIVDQGGKFNQTSLSNALKKGCDKLITKLFEK